MPKRNKSEGEQYCSFCGSKIDNKLSECKNCGKPCGENRFEGIEIEGAGGKGWSYHASDKCFRRKNRIAILSVLVSAAAVAVIICAVLMFLGHIDVKSSIAAFIGIIVIVFVFVVIIEIDNFTSHNDWEGYVKQKETFSKEFKYKDKGGNKVKENHQIYRIYFMTTGGRVKSLVTVDNSKWYDYLSEGDKVRYHGKNMSYYEKFDKTKDNVIPCALCKTMRDAREKYCANCGARILKGRTPKTYDYENEEKK